MSPRRLDPYSVHAKLAAMGPLIERLDRMGAPTAQDLTVDFDRRLVAERVLIALVDLSVSVNAHVLAAGGRRIPSEYQQSFHLVVDAGVISADLGARLAPLAGQRNVLVHRYSDIDVGLVAEAVPVASAGYADFVRQVSRWLLAQGDP